VNDSEIAKGMRPWEISDDVELLDFMLKDSAAQHDLYRPGVYWRNKAKAQAREIRRLGLSNFRGRGNGIGLSFVDKTDIDVRYSLNLGLRRVLKFFLTHAYPFNKAFDGQVRLSCRIADEAASDKSAWLQASARVKDLLTRYRMPYSVGGGCVDWLSMNGERIATHYLATLDAIDNLQGVVAFSSASRFFEIGGGFGANVHLLLSNFPNIRKVVYLDIPPNLYVGTQYLRSHFGSAVIDYRALRNAEQIRFSEDESLEIFCIAPWQIEKLDVDVEIFHNANSFVEMPVEVIQNYATHVQRLLKRKRGAISLISYDNYDLSTTIHPSRLPGFFGGAFEEFQRYSVVSPGSPYYYFARKPG
jgi:putative sugar O-methyltransferase